MNALADFHFLRPAWLLAVLLVPLAWMLWQRVRGMAASWKSVVDEHLLPHLVETTHERARNGGAWLAALLWLLACIALAGPAWEREPLALSRTDAARVPALERPPTMPAADIKPTRLERARYKLNDILDASRDLQTALIGYAGDAFVAAPLTDDVNTVRNLIDALDPGVMPAVGNNTERAIAEAQKLIAQAGLKHGELILLADSASNGALAAARRAHAQGLTVSVLGVGSAKGAPVPLPQGGFLQDASGNIVLPRLDEPALRALAQAGGGRYATLTTDRSDLNSLLVANRDASNAAVAEGDHATSERFRDRGPWVLLLLVPLAAIAFRRGWLMVLGVALIVPAPPAQALEWMDLWQRPDQRAAEALAQGDAARAQEIARDPQWRGSAAYRAGDYATATDSFARATGADALYNQGNALAKAGKYEEAIDAYQRALAANPALDDATANKQAVEDWLKRQQSQDQKNRQDNKNQQDRNKDSAGKQESSGKDESSGESQQGKPKDQQGSGQEGTDEQKADEAKQEGPQSAGNPSADAQKDTRQSSSNEKGEPKDTSQAEPNASPKNAAEAAADKLQREQQQEQVSKAIDKALDGKPAGAQAPVAASEARDEAATEQQQALNQWLQRVPDDPGGLLRRKFQLEYERRQRDGGGE